jgi:hypothetical protein
MGLHAVATVVAVPEPGALSLLALGSLALLRRRRAVTDEEGSSE